jgi:putative spermidine/putrescine transport system substrate-binding protein
VSELTNKRCGFLASACAHGQSVGLAAGFALGMFVWATSLDAEETPQEGGTTLSIATWGGAYGQSQEIAYFEPFAKESGTRIETETYDGSTAKLKEMIESDQPLDVVDVSSAALGTLCSEGLLETIEASALGSAPGGESAEQDYFSGGLTSCGVASVAWSTAIAFDSQAFAKAQPTQIVDLLDTKRFPGKRALPKGPRYTLELALLADGVPPENVYSELATPAGVDRAFGVLDKIKDSTLWWDDAQQPITWLLEEKVAMAAGYSGRIFRAAVGGRKRVSIIWDGQIYDLDLWAIPKAARNKDGAKRFITFATDPSRLAAQAQLTSYGPMRKSAVTLVGKHPVINVEMKDYLPTAPDNFKKALRFDGAFWSTHGEVLGKRFAEWHAQVEAAQAAAEAERKAKKPSPDEGATKAAP